MTIDQNTIDSQIIRLVDEGVPVGALARAFGRRAEDLWPVIRLGVASGFLTALPAADWPPGTTRGARRPLTAQQPRLRAENLITPLQRVYRLTPGEARFLAFLVVQREGSSEAILEAIAAGGRSPTDSLVKVTACTLRRKLSLYDLGVHTLWGFGYKITPRDRQTIVDELQRYEASRDAEDERAAMVDQALADGI